MNGSTVKLRLVKPLFIVAKALAVCKKKGPFGAFFAAQNGPDVYKRQALTDAQIFPARRVDSVHDHAGHAAHARVALAPCLTLDQAGQKLARCV